MPKNMYAGREHGGMGWADTDSGSINEALRFLIRTRQARYKIPPHSCNPECEAVFCIRSAKVKRSSLLHGLEENYKEKG